MNTLPTQWKKAVKISLILLSLLCVAVILFSFKEGVQADNKNVKETEVTEITSSPFENLSLEAQSVYVWDMNKDRVIYAKNSEEILPLASLSKVMTALIAKEAMSDRYIQISTNDLAAEGDDGLMGYEMWKVDDLIDFMLIVSSNDGADSLASAYTALKGERFVDAMNRAASSLNLSSLYFTNPSGLDAQDLTESGGYGSIKDVVLLFDYVLQEYPTLLEATREDTLVFTSASNFQHVAENTNNLVDRIPFMVGSKTGFTDLAGGNLVIVFDAGIGERYIIGLLGSSIEGRFVDMEKLYSATIEYIQSKSK